MGKTRADLITVVVLAWFVLSAVVVLGSILIDCNPAHEEKPAKVGVDPDGGKMTGDLILSGGVGAFNITAAPGTGTVVIAPAPRPYRGNSGCAWVEDGVGRYCIPCIDAEVERLDDHNVRN